MSLSEILGSLIQSGMTASSQDRLRNSLGGGREGGGGLLESLASMIGGSGSGGGGLLEGLSSMLGGGAGGGGVAATAGNEKPQFLQNFAESGFSVPHAGQNIGTSHAADD